MLLGLDGLMQTVRITAARHDTSGEFIDNENFIVLYDIIMILLHQVVGAQRENDAVLDLQIFRIRKVADVEELLRLRDALLCEVHDLVLLVDEKVSGLLLLDAHDGINLRKVLDVLASLHLLGKNVAGLINLRGFTALSGNDERRSRFIDENRVDLIDDRIMQVAQNQLFLVDGHVVTKIVESELIVRDIGDVACIGCPALIAGHAVQNDTACKAHELIRLAHPFAVTLCEVIVDRDNVDAFSLQCVEIARKCCNQRLAFTGAHLCDSSLMKDDAANDLYLERFHAERPAVGLAHCRKRFRQDVIQCLAIGQTLFEFICFGAELFIRKCLHFIAQRQNLVNNRTDALQLMIAVRTENFTCKTCHILPLLQFPPSKPGTAAEE